jgi:SAM-dependent methyltransferase
VPLVDPFVESFPDDAVILNVGSGGRKYGRDSIINIDIEPGPLVDVVGVAEELPIRDGVVDGVVLQAVLEHVADSEKTLAEIVRVLRPGGRVMIELPFMQGYHASPADYRRYTAFGLRHELQRHGLEVTAGGVGIGPASAFAWVTSEFLAILLSGRSKRLYHLTRMLTRPLVWPVQWLDSILQQHPMAHLIASSVWAEARKPDSPSAAPGAAM